MESMIQTILFAVVLIAVGMYIITIPSPIVWWFTFALGFTFIGGGVLTGYLLSRR